MTRSRLFPPFSRVPFARLCVAALAILALGGQSGAREDARTPLADQVDLIRAHTTIQLPDTASGPVPAAILLHGCGGLRAVQRSYATDLLAAGYAVITVDSNSARGIGRTAAMTQVCTALRLWGQERAADVSAAIELAREEPGIDADRLAVIGWSHGGWTLLEALTYAGETRLPPALGSGAASAPLLPGVRAAVAIYPYCGFPVRADGGHFPAGIAVHAILAERDLIADPRDCVRTFARAADAGTPVEHAVWPGITHAFDEPDQPPDPRMEYDPDAAHRARIRVVEILDEAFAR